MDTTENTSPRKRFSCCLIVALCVATPAIAVALLVGWVVLIHRIIPAPALVISEETTRITGPLTADGRVDFFRALEQRVSPPELATDENGFRVFVRLFGDVGYEGEPEEREFYRLQLYEKLLIMPEFVAAAFACNLGIGLARIAQKGHDLPCFCETKK